MSKKPDNLIPQITPEGFAFLNQLAGVGEEDDPIFTSDNLQVRPVVRTGNGKVSWTVTLVKTDVNEAIPFLTIN